MNYEKLTLDRFALNLKEGKYDTATGARRAIGKTSSWKQAEKEQAQALVNKHFKIEASSAAKPAAKKIAPAKKSTAKKAAKKVATKAAAPTPEPKADVEKAAPVKRTPHVEKLHTKAASAPVTVGATDAVVMSHQLLDIAGRAREEINKARSADPSADFTGIEKEFRLVLHRGLALVNVSTETVTDAAGLPPARVSLPSPTPTATPKHVAKTIPPTVAPIPVAAPPVIETKPVATEPVANGTGHELTPEEQRIADEIRNTTPSQGIAGLPRPTVPTT